MSHDHPLPLGTMLERRHESERTEVLLEIAGRFRDIDDGHLEYELTDPTHTGYYRYRAEDVDDCFDGTELVNEDGRKPLGQPDIRERYQNLHEEHDEHSFSEVVDSDGEPAGRECIHCGLPAEYSDHADAE